MVEERLETIVHMCNSDNKNQYKSIVINDGFKVIQIALIRSIFDNRKKCA